MQLLADSTNLIIFEQSRQRTLELGSAFPASNSQFLLAWAQLARMGTGACVSQAWTMPVRSSTVIDSGTRHRNGSAVVASW